MGACPVWWGIVPLSSHCLLALFTLSGSRYASPFEGPELGQDDTKKRTENGRVKQDA